MSGSRKNFQSAPDRDAVGPGRPGGRESRDRIVTEAGKLFARHGFDAISIRAIARAADVNLASIAYYFGGKQGLYRAVMERLIDDTAPLVQPLKKHMRQSVAAAGDDRRALAKLAAEFVCHTMDSILTGDQLKWQHELMLREFSQPSDEFPIVMARSIDPMHDAVAILVAAALEADEKDEQVRLLTASVVGQCMIFGIARPLVCGRLGWIDYNAERIKTLIMLVTATVQRSLNLPETGPATPGGMIRADGGLS